ncbi:MAG: SUMF1/EgtB/PvdO family nonheme iron enzyme [Candidatus Aenigmarchaeota archaeon]|nr:SUMF1/EgtB/PvdO family nonheme iron enzyme [Candidatus Aenigmarchaeota archaeon]
MEWIDAIPWVLVLAAIFFGIYQYSRRKKDLKQEKIAELEASKKFEEEMQMSAAWTAAEIYSAALREGLGTIHLLGSPDIESRPVRVEDAFVSLVTSESWRSENRFEVPDKMEKYEIERYLTPEKIMKRTFQNFRLLLVIGDPGSGKTTLLKYYALWCLDKRHRELGFKEEVFVIYFPLRDLEFRKVENGRDDFEPTFLHENLAKWAERHLLSIPAEQFHQWLQHRKTLVLLDGLDEISIKERRRKVCKWIGRMVTGLSNAYFVLTSRATGYRKLDGIELEVPHLRADIMDFSPQQQEEFLKKWFQAVFLSELSPESIREHEWKQQQLKRADKQSRTIIEFLSQEENKSVRELAAVPMLLQIMAILWKVRSYLPHSRSALYDATLNYLLEYRDREKDIEPLLPAYEARLVLAPIALWMQEELQKDEAPKSAVHEKMQPILDTMEGQPRATEFCEHLRDRTGLIADYDRDHYIFRHKSFQEFLAALQLHAEAYQTNRLESLIDNFGDDWWEETLRFFISNSNDTIFDRFMYSFFHSDVSKQLDSNKQTLLQLLIKEAPQKKIDALKESLNSDRLNNNQKRYVLDCLKTIGTPEAVKAIEAFIEKSKEDEVNLDHARDIVAELTTAVQRIEEIAKKDTYAEILNSFRNPFEDNVEYINIPGDTYKYSATKQTVTVPDLYFCKYPVTNKRYRRFISFLEGSEKKLLKFLPLDIFAGKLLKFTESRKGYRAYLGENFKKWQFKLRSSFDEDKKFTGDDQPVIGVSWYAARAYCLWLSCLEVASRGDKRIENMDINQLASIYRLPTEKEWEWAAGGEPDGHVRQYPWAAYKGEPNPNLANYDKNVGATTPVGRYPEGATPLGLMDVAGNAWEWMENYYDYDRKWYALRGGSWYDDASNMLCSARSSGGPDLDYDVIGFRVLRTQ